MIKGNFYLNDFNAGVIGEKFKGNIASEIVKRALRGSQNCIPIDNGGFSRRNGFQFIDELPIPSANTEYRLEMVIGDAGTEYLLGFYPGGVQVFDKEGVVLAAALETQMYSVWDIDLVSTIAGVVLVDGIVEPVLIGLDSTPTSDIYANFIPRPYAYYYAVVTNSGTTFTVSNPADPTGLDEFGNAVDYLNLMGDALVGMFFLVYREPATAYELHGQITSVAYSSGRVLSFTYDGATDRIAGSINTSGARIVLIYPESWGPTAGFKFLGSPDTMSFSYFHPNKVTIHENRLVFGGLLDYSTGKKDGDHWSISAINSIRTFPPYSAAAGSFELVPVQPDAAFTWIYSHKRLYYGTANGIFQFGQID
ncbi:MAG TPA: hypothetical protein ENH40_02475, partial [Nitrospirae bacterium]|nr:hypothetical protein [Nitrospirota bacterium]